VTGVLSGVSVIGSDPVAVGQTDPAGQTLVMGTGPGTYVALGDSYSSGEGTFSYESSSNIPKNQCHRATNGWVATVASTLGYGTDSASGPTSPNFKFVACSGDITTNFFHALAQPGWSEPPQLESVTSADTLVTLSIGGNDSGFAAVIRGCLSYAPFDKIKEYKNWNTQQCGVEIGKAQKKGLDALNNNETGLMAILTRIHKQAPGAQIRVVPYPYVIDPIAAATTLCVVGSFSTGIPTVSPSLAFSSGAAMLLFKFQQALDAQIGFLANSWANEPANAGVMQLVQDQDAFTGGMICDPGHADMNALVGATISFKIGKDGPHITPSVPQESFHPNLTGQVTSQTSIAKAVLASLPPS
jgi:hypothetical protein